MTFLELCKRARQEAGITGSGPTSVLNQTGQLGLLVDWVAQSWIDIQLMRPNWRFMIEEFSFDTVADTRDYLAADYSITDMNLWDTASFLIYKTATGESDQNRIEYLRYEQWRAAYRTRMNDRGNDRPIAFTLMPNNSVRFEPRPDDVYTIEGDYKRSTQEFSADADVPTNLPDDFHMIIVWQALKYYAHYENALEVMDEAETNFDNLLHRLELEQLPLMSDDFEALA